MPLNIASLVEESLRLKNSSIDYVVPIGKKSLTQVKVHTMISDLIKDIAKVAGVKGLLILLSGIATTYVTYEAVKESPEEVIEEEVEVAEKAPASNNFRKIASQAKSLFAPSKSNNQSEVKVTQYDKEKFVESGVEPETNDFSAYRKDEETTSPIGFGSSSSNFVAAPSSGGLGDFSFGDSGGGSSSGSRSSSGSGSSSSSGDSSVVSSVGSAPVAEADNEKPTSSNTNTSKGGGSAPAATITNTCAPSILGGSFGNPIGVTISCDLPSTVKYCLSDNGTCCDPETAGTTYSSSVVIGPKNANYCLSFVGENATTGVTTVSEYSYQINSTFPNLTVTFDKTYYQSTELDAITLAHSTNFGSNNYFMHQLNLKSHDPGLSGLNYDCDEIMTNYSSLTTPNVVEVLLDFDIAGLTPASQVEIPLALGQMDYGDNYITTFVVNNNFVAPLRSCATTRVILEDFEYFQADVSHGESGTNSVREFEGGFLSYGFFEDDANVYRGPAGESVSSNTSESLQSGMFGMFY